MKAVSGLGLFLDDYFLVYIYLEPFSRTFQIASPRKLTIVLVLGCATTVRTGEYAACVGGHPDQLEPVGARGFGTPVLYLWYSCGNSSIEAY